MFLHADHVRVHVADVVNVREDEGLCWIKAERQDILHVIAPHLDRAFWPIKLNLLLVDVLLVVGGLNHEGHVEDALQPLRENERDTVSHVKCVSGGTSTCVQIEGLAVLISVQDLLKVTLAEENTSSDEPVRFFSDSAFQTSDKLWGDWEAPILVDEFVVVNARVVLCFDVTN